MTKSNPANPGATKQAKRAARLLLAVGIVLLPLTVTQAANAQTLTSLFIFDGTDGANPYAALVQGTDGNLYGTTWSGGANEVCPGSSGPTTCGTVFKITTGGTFTTLHSFMFTDGWYPYAALVQASNGALYGTTYLGGTSSDSDCSHSGCGTLFEISPEGRLTTLHSFNSTDGESPVAGLIQATNGRLYGTTAGGGAYGEGTIFEATLAGALTTLHSFDNADGQQPLANLVQASDGNFYGTTAYGGGDTSCLSGCGTVFRITAAGMLTTLHNFHNTDGANPYAGLIQASDGNLYGTTYDGGAKNYGTLFKITLSGKVTTLHNFDFTDGWDVSGGLVQASDGNLYGTTLHGGAYGAGTIFKMTLNGTFTMLESVGIVGGLLPYPGLVQNTNGSFYGTTTTGGYDNECGDGCGTVFSFSIGLGPFVETQTTSGTVGATVKVLGTNLTGTTSVTFNGTAASFTVVSASEISTTVPEGATTGTVQVVTPSDTLSSNAPFLVIP